ncbi:MAG: hypothetical protein IKS31_01440 [Clostridia bacterium]|nr:hypothetical protein [Clostridia bacterium]
MPDREKVLLALEHHKKTAVCNGCPYAEDDDTHEGYCPVYDDALALLREQEPRVMTLEEVIKHYSLPPVFVDDLGAQEDYLQDIAPLYFDFPQCDSWVVHWRGYQSVRKYIEDWKASYGQKWRCWTARPTDEQREAVKWDD